jgi:hypothetical protein
MQRKAKIIADKDFRANFGKATTDNENNFIKNYVSADPSEPPMLHKFRVEKREEWVGG